MLCQSRLHTASETFVHHKKFRSVSISCIFVSIASILIGKDGEYEKTHTKISDVFKDFQCPISRFHDMAADRIVFCSNIECRPTVLSILH